MHNISVCWLIWGIFLKLVKWNHWNVITFLYITEQLAILTLMPTRPWLSCKWFSIKAEATLKTFMAKLYKWAYLYSSWVLGPEKYFINRPNENGIKGLKTETK